MRRTVSASTDISGSRAALGTLLPVLAGFAGAIAKLGGARQH
jgi:hypothetical protein